MSDERYRKFFSEADTDGSGYLTIQELTDMLRRKGYNGSDAEIMKMFNCVDTSGDNQISLEEFLVGMGVLPQQDHKAAAIRSIFQSFDKNSDGTLDRTELDQGFRELGSILNPRELDRVFRMADKDQSGAIDYEEFIAHFLKK